MVDTKITDGSGKGGGAVTVAGGRIFTKSVQQTALEDVSAETGQAYVYSSTFVTGGTDVEVLAITNDIKQHLHVDQVWLQAAAAATFKVGWMSSGTPAGTTIIGGPLNADLSQTADTTAFGNAAVTGTILLANGFAYMACPADAPVMYDMEGAWVGGKNDTFVVSCETNTTVRVTVIAHMDAID